MAVIDRPVEFWLIWSVGERNSSRSHKSRESADREAERLAQKHPFRNFFIVRAERKVRHTFKRGSARAPSEAAQ